MPEGFGNRRFSDARREKLPSEKAPSLIDKLRGWGNPELATAVKAFQNISGMMEHDTHTSDAKDRDAALNRVNEILESDRQLKNIFRPPLTAEKLLDQA